MDPVGKDYKDNKVTGVMKGNRQQRPRRLEEGSKAVAARWKKKAGR